MAIGAVWLALATILCLEGYLLWQVRTAAWQMAVRTAENATATLSVSIARNLNIVDLSLAGLQETVEQFDLSGMEPRLRNSTLFDRAASAEDLGAMLVLSENGDVLYDNAGWPPRAGNFADRDYFRVHVNTQRGPYLAKPYVSRLREGDHSVAISRRWSDADGHFKGVLIGAIRLAYFTNLLGRVNLGPRAVLGIARDDGTVLTRVPSTDGTWNVGLDLSRSEVMQKVLSGAPQLFNAMSKVDGIERTYVYEKIGSFPLYLVVGFSHADVLDSWITEAATIFGLGTLACFIIIALFLSLQRVLDRQMDVERDLERLATTDVLTGLSNRRYFDEVLQREWDRSRRMLAPLSLMLIDVDYFKAVNDKLGHAAGDAVLRTIASTIAASLLRPGDMVARYGGDEFAVLLANTDQTGALTVASRIREGVASLQAQALNGGTMVAGTLVAGTVSVGIGTGIVVPDSVSSVEDLFRASDRALYRAKRGGRDRVEACGIEEGMEPFDETVAR
ncbi:deoxyribonuclease [Azorhizobium oxalatiphilum]|uniref:diguanylate cyclase n=1 Tax=Azorhizobium oxalatiphilum TaxID=980631 RepID=A0A917F7Z8_9HYPH|nr:sensor domain-containing diguanylate cyclase [Azorhizobium oxalatiphilum]GGF58917.1 deoxyribonuclease [Azorhizobium oxalatiphilum]